MPYDKKYLDSVDKEELLNAIHTAVSFTYLQSEIGRLQSRLELKKAAGWLGEVEEKQILERLKELRDRPVE